MRARPRLGDLPNVLSLSRILLAAGFVAADGVVLRAGLIGAAGLSDVLDGWLARRLNAATRWGALIDPFADRVFVLAATVTLAASGAITASAALVLLARDIATAVGFLVALAIPRLRPREFKARWLGKLVTVLQFAALLCAVVAPELFAPLLVLVGVGAAWSIVDYTVTSWRARAGAA
ncbi:MAG: CDP-alcohol phosphatidyltransferase family protein [Gemmatimonadaceae bacterium]